MKKTSIGNPAQARDIESIRALWRSVGDVSTLDTEAARKMMTGLEYFVLRGQNERIVGATSLWLLGRGLGKVESLAVDPEDRGRGYASSLAQRAIEYAFGPGKCTTLITHAMPSSQGLFLRLGFAQQEVHDSGNMTMYLDKK